MALEGQDKNITKKNSLVKKLVKILGETGKVKKSGMNTHHKYQYTTESDLLELLRPKLVEAGIFIFSSVETVIKEDNITTVTMKHTFVDSASGEEYIVHSAGQGQDTQDKGVYKALTGSMKYMLWKNFLIESNDDPEADNANPGYVKSSGTNTKKTTSQPQATTSASKSFIKNAAAATAAAVVSKTEDPKKRSFGDSSNENSEPSF